MCQEIVSISPRFCGVWVVCEHIRRNCVRFHNNQLQVRANKNILAYGGLACILQGGRRDQDSGSETGCASLGGWGTTIWWLGWIARTRKPFSSWKKEIFSSPLRRRPISVQKHRSVVNLAILPWWYVWCGVISVLLLRVLAWSTSSKSYSMKSMFEFNSIVSRWMSVPVYSRRNEGIFSSSSSTLGNPVRIHDRLSACLLSFSFLWTSKSNTASRRRHRVKQTNVSVIFSNHFGAC